MVYRTAKNQPVGNKRVLNDNHTSDDPETNIKYLEQKCKRIRIEL